MNETIIIVISCLFLLSCLFPHLLKRSYEGDYIKK
jgi:hypothetical protein